MSEESPKIRDLVQRAAADGGFAHRLLDDPASVAAEYNLTSAQIEKIKELADQGVFKPAVEAHGATPAYY